MLTGVRLSTGGLVPGGVPAPEEPGPRGLPGPRGVPGHGGVPGPRGVPAPGGVPGGDPPDGYCCGQNASYWNAFL